MPTASSDWKCCRKKRSEKFKVNIVKLEKTRGAPKANIFLNSFQSIPPNNSRRVHQTKTAILATFTASLATSRPRTARFAAASRIAPSANWAIDERVSTVTMRPDCSLARNVVYGTLDMNARTKPASESRKKEAGPGEQSRESETWRAKKPPPAMTITETATVH